MPTRTRISYKVARGLDDITCATSDARRALDIIKRGVVTRRNYELTLALLNLTEALAEIERRARDARAGNYED